MVPELGAVFWLWWRCLAEQHRASGENFTAPAGTPVLAQRPPPSACVRPCMRRVCMNQFPSAMDLWVGNPCHWQRGVPEPQCGCPAAHTQGCTGILETLRMGGSPTPSCTSGGTNFKVKISLRC